MADLIERTEELVLAVNAGARAIENTKRYHGTTYCIDVFADKPKEIPYLKAAQILRGFDELHAVDVVEVQAIEKWLYQIAMNNVGQPVEDMAAACEIIISRLDGLRRFAKEWREENAAD